MTTLNQNHQHNDSDEGDLMFLNDLGWLSALSLAIVIFIPYIFSGNYLG